MITKEQMNTIIKEVIKELALKQKITSMESLLKTIRVWNIYS